MTAAEATRTMEKWEQAIGEKVHSTMPLPEMARYFEVKMTAERASGKEH
jgi:hypothetical protein